MVSGNISVHPHRRHPNLDHSPYTVHVFGQTIRTVVTCRPSAVRRWLHNIRRAHGRRLGSLVVGLGVQWRPKPRRSAPDPPPATLQLCVGGRCLVFLLLHSRNIPAALRRFLSDARITFVGVGNKSDLRKLCKHRELVVTNGVEIRNLTRERMGRWNVAMETLARQYLGYYGVKDSRIGRTAWDAEDLTAEQVQYACVDAYISFRLGLKLLR